MPTISYQTLGCKVNQYETEKIRQNLESVGFVTHTSGSISDVYIINTCSVTSIADSKSRAAVRKAIRLNPDAYVVVCGCFAELAPHEASAIEGVDLVVSNDEKDLIPERIKAHFDSLGIYVEVLAPNLDIKPLRRTRAVIKVQDGCDQFCSYCIIPYARSNKSSRSIDDVLSEIQTLSDFGYKEVVLTGIRLGSYGDGVSSLAELINKATKIEGIERVRLSSIEPWEVNNRLLDEMMHPKVCRHLHIPLQSGDDQILKLMNRPYLTSEYMDIINNVRDRLPGIGITTDIIVGFPGETDELFNNTCEFVKAVGFSRLHVFRYSIRKGTKASEMPFQVSPQDKHERGVSLIEIGHRSSKAFAESFIGSTLDVLVEKQIPKTELYTGYTDNYIEVHFPAASGLKGKIRKVEIISVDANGTALGKLV